MEGYGFTFAQIVEDEEAELSRYKSLLLREVEGQPYTAGGETVEPIMTSATQAYADSDGEWAEGADGTFTYTFANKSELDFSFTYALEEDITGINSLQDPDNPPQTVTLSMNQWEVGIGYSWKF